MRFLLYVKRDNLAFEGGHMPERTYRKLGLADLQMLVNTKNEADTLEI